MDVLTDLLGLALVAAGGFGAGFEFRMIRAGFWQRVLTPAARLFQTYVIFIVVGLAFVSQHWHNTTVTWSLTGLGPALVIAQGALRLRPIRPRSRA
jgi:hypothetical protein